MKMITIRNLEDATHVLRIPWTEPIEVGDNLFRYGSGWCAHCGQALPDTFWTVEQVETEMIQ
jgi:hypothetical protein